MKKLIATALAFSAFSAMADEDKINYSFGLKEWNHKFKQDTTNTENVNAGVMSVTARKGDYFVTGSTLLPTTYSMRYGYQLYRRDTDLALGYQIHPNISLLGGQKNVGVRQYNPDTNALTSYQLKLTYLGANGFQSINDNSFVYGTYTQSFKSRDTSNNATTMKFTNYEFGYGYVLSKDTQLTAGYRYQKFADTSTTTLPGIIFGVNITP